MEINSAALLVCIFRMVWTALSVGDTSTSSSSAGSSAQVSRFGRAIPERGLRFIHDEFTFTCDRRRRR